MLLRIQGRQVSLASHSIAHHVSHDLILVGCQHLELTFTLGCRREATVSQLILFVLTQQPHAMLGMAMACTHKKILLDGTGLDTGHLAGGLLRSCCHYTSDGLVSSLVGTLFLHLNLLRCFLLLPLPLGLRIVLLLSGLCVLLLGLLGSICTCLLDLLVGTFQPILLAQCLVDRVLHSHLHLL